jgi:N-acetylglucosamine-6-phosphate deacetylase
MITALHNLQIISDGSITRGKAVLISGSQINDIIDEHAIPESTNKIDLEGAFLAPGLIDLQLYGSGGLLFAGKPTVEALERFLPPSAPIPMISLKRA